MTTSTRNLIGKACLGAGCAALMFVILISAEHRLTQNVLALVGVLSFFAYYAIRNQKEQ